MAGNIAPLTVYEPPQEPLNIIYQDDDILVLDKPSGLLTVKGKDKGLEDCLEARACAIYPKARIVHRLDMHTSGLIIMALHAGSHRNLSAQFEHRKVHKIYEALVWGQVEQEQGIIDLPLRCDWENRPRQMVDHKLGKPSQTRFELMSRSDDFCRLSLYPKTGRSHQLRVHMLALGHPILGDEFYANEIAIKASPRALNGLCLHAKELGVEHPIMGSFMLFKSQPYF